MAGSQWWPGPLPPYGVTWPKRVTLFHSEISIWFHYSDVIMGVMASQITSLTIVYSTFYSGQIKETSKLRVPGLCVGNSPATGEFPAQMASNAENVSIWWRHHQTCLKYSRYRPYKYSLLMHCIKIKSPAKSLLNEQYAFVGENISFLCVLSCSSEET